MKLRAPFPLLASLLATLLAACSRDRPRLVVWIEVDTLRADALGCYGNDAIGENGAAPSPAIDALAADGVQFARAYTAAPWTIPSLVTQLSGRWPWEHGATRLLEPVAGGDLPLVPALRARGWRTAGVMTNFVAKGEYGFGHGFERFDDSLAQGHEGSTAGAALARLLGFADEMRAAGDEPLFLFAWLFEPHWRYEAHEGLRFGPGFGSAAGESYGGALTGGEDLNALLRRRGELDEADARFLRGRYASEVAWLDRALGEFVAGLKQRGLYDDALIVFTSDHGEEILDRGWIGHTVTLHEELVRVPLVFRLPGGERRGTKIDHPVSLIDLPATLLDLMTGEEPDRWRGELGHSRSLAPTLVDGRAPERRWIYLHTDFVPVLDAGDLDKRAHAWGVIDAGSSLKWIVDHNVPPGEAPRTHLYDLARDAAERTNLATGDAGAQAAARMQRLRGLVPAALDGRRGAPAALPEEPWIRDTGEVDGLGPGFDDR